MKFILPLFISLTLLSCQESVTNKNSVDCASLIQVNNDLEVEIEENLGQIITLLATSNPTSTNPITIQDIRISSLGSSFSGNCESLKQSIKEGDAVQVEYLTNKLHHDLDELTSIFEIKFWPHHNLTPNCRIHHDEITSLHSLLEGNCDELAHLKINSLQNKFLNNITQIMNRSMDFFNKFKPIAYSDKYVINRGDSLALHVGFIGFDSTDFSHIQYWIDDSTMNPNKVSNYYMEKPLSISGEIGTHTVYGKIRQFNAGFFFWKHWKFEFEVQ